MKPLKLFTIIIALFFMTGMIIAQVTKKDGHGPHGDHPHHGRTMNPDTMAKRQTAYMKSELALKDEQVAKVQDINLKYAQKVKALMDQMHEQMQAVEKEKVNDLSTVLTSDQLKKYNEMKPAHFHGKKGGDHKREGKCEGKCKDKKDKK
jgi:Spy/CpxP family protein refolding chaperone